MAETGKSRTPRGPERRSMLLALVLLGVGAGAYFASTSKWFYGAYGIDGKYKWVPLTPETLATMGMVPSPTGPRPAMYELMGLPASTTWVLVAVGVGVLAFVTRLGLLALVGVGAAWMGRSSALFAQELLLRSEELDGRVKETGSGLASYLDWLWILMVVLVLLAAQITYAGHRRRSAMTEEEREDEPTVVNTLESVQAAALTRLAQTSPKKRTQARGDSENVHANKEPAKAPEKSS